jgi:AcrR family transcriptional regulator
MAKGTLDQGKVAEAKKKMKRKRGQRAGLTRAKIRDAAIKLWANKRTEDFQVLALAKELKVVPVSISSHFRGGIDEILDEIARFILNDWAKPYGPQIDPKTYLKELFELAVQYPGASPSISREVACRLADQPLLSPVFAERVCATLAALAPKSDPAAGLMLVINRLVGLLLLGAGRWAGSSHNQVGKEVDKTISDLPENEFPTLKKLEGALAAAFAQKSSSSYFENLATAAVEEIVAELNAAKSQ